MTPDGTLTMLPDKPLLILIDGHALVYRAWHAIRQPMTVRSTGEEVRAVYGFVNTFLRSLSDWQPTDCAIAFDVSAPTFRHLLYKEYKAQRPPTPPELPSQFNRVHEIMEAFAVPIFEVEGYEADDVLGTLCRQAEDQKLETLILTVDTDMLQLVSPWVRVLLSYGVQNQTVYDEATVRERYGGLGPELVPDLKALQGDPSDNIPGVPGIGAKTARRLLAQCGSLEGIYEDLDTITPATLQRKLSDNRDRAFQGKTLTTISRDVPITLDLEASKFWKYDRAKVVAVLKGLEFFSIVSNIPATGVEEAFENGEVAAPPDRLQTDYSVVDTEEALEEMVSELEGSGGFSFDTETTSKNPMAAELVGLSFSNGPGRGWYLPVGHLEGVQLPLDQALDRIRPLMESETISKAAHNANYDMTVLANYDVPVRNLRFDTMLAAHVSGRKSIGLKALALECFNEEMTPITDLIGTGKKQITMAQVAIDRTADYAAADADFTQRLWPILERELTEKSITELFSETEMPLVPVLVRMQRNGVSLDADLLQKMSIELQDKLSRIETEMYTLVGHQFKLNSPQQLSEVLFTELRLPPTKRRQRGFSTDASSLDALKEMLDQGESEGVYPKAYQVLEQVLEYRQLAKIRSTYVDALPSLVNPKTGRIHTSYNQTGSATGRVSSNDPNVQNIPVRTELGRRVRNAFVARDAPEWTLLGADYSQIEMRILAHLSQDPALIDAFRSGEDLHDATSSLVYEVPIDQVTEDMRRVAKILNFGVLYGLTAHGISRQTDLSPAEGQRFIDIYFDRYSKIRGYVEETKRRCKELGYVETILGRRRYFPEITASNFHVRNAAERAAINMPIQGTAADIIKIAMIRIQERLDSLALRSMMIIQVHDELIFETPQEELDQMKGVVMELMPSAMKLSVPLEVELKTGYTWSDMK